MQVILRPAAAADIEDAISWYDRQRPGGAIQSAGARVAEAQANSEPGS